MKGILLISSGIDSPIAGKLMIEKGVEINGLHFFMDEKNLEKTKLLAEKLKIKLFIVDHNKTQLAIKQNCNPRCQCILCKRMMYRVAEKFAKDQKADFIVTGENLSQVASQTLSNMQTLDNAVKINVLRPLLAMDKQETINLSKKYGLYDISIIKSPSCPYLPLNPATRSEIHKIIKEEEKLNMGDLLDVKPVISDKFKTP